MSSDLIQALLIFAGSAVLVIFSGIYLARYGDALAGLMGWGRLWVGTVLVASATSLPELVTNITAASRDQPDLAGGNILGTNMANMLVLAVAALLLGKERFFRQAAPEQKFLGSTAILLTGLAVVLGAFHLGVSFLGVGLASVLILVLYLGGMRLVYVMRPREVGKAEADPSPDVLPSLRKAWTFFGLASLGVIVAAPALIFSVEEIAKNTGLAVSFLGVVAVAIVTSMPEAATTIASARIGAIDLGIGNIYGSCAFNIFILAIVDPFYRQGTVVETLGTEHVAAGLVAVVLMGLGLWQIMLRGSSRYLPVVPTLAAMVLIYGGGLYLVYNLGRAA